MGLQAYDLSSPFDRFSIQQDRHHRQQQEQCSLTWQGYSEADRTWEPFSHLMDTVPDEVHKFEMRKKLEESMNAEVRRNGDRAAKSLISQQKNQKSKFIESD